MSTPRYLWRKLTNEQRGEILAWRKDNARPWHSPPHRPNFGHLHFLVSGACYRHVPHIGFSLGRMDRFSVALSELFQQQATRLIAWCVLPNHYHALVEAPNILKLLHELGRLHGRTSHAWNGEENTHHDIERRGRGVRGTPDRLKPGTPNGTEPNPTPTG